MFLLHLCLLLSIFDWNVLSVIRLKDRSDVWRLEDPNGCYDGVVRLRWEPNLNIDIHSRKGIIAMRPLSFGSPVHFGIMIAFSGCAETCSGCTSRTTTFDRSRLRYDRSYALSALITCHSHEDLTFTG